MSRDPNLCCGPRPADFRRCAPGVGVVFLLALGVYALTLAPDLTWAHWGADGGDLVVAAVARRLPHPPGFPLYEALARAFVRLPWGSPAWRTNLLSALLAAATAATLAWTLLRRGVDPVIVVSTSLLLAATPLLWSQALITEVYAPAAFFAALTVAWTQETPVTSRRAFVGGCIWGWGLSVHPALIFLAPLWGGVPRRLWASWAGGVVVGLLPYALLPLIGAGPQPWGDVHNLAGWWDYVTARLYWGYAFALPWKALPQRFLAWLALLIRQFTPVGAALAAVGAASLARRERLPFWRTLLAFGAASAYALGYHTTDSLVYLTPYLIIPALWLAEGATQVVARLDVRRARWWSLALPLVALLWQWGALDLHRDTSAREWWEATLRAAPPGAVLVTAADAHTFTLWYAQEAVGARPDITVVDRDLWAQASYRQFMGASAADPAPALDTFFAGRVRCTVDTAGLTCP